jgi:hypothetical protein
VVLACDKVVEGEVSVDVHATGVVPSSRNQTCASSKDYIRVSKQYLSVGKAEGMRATLIDCLVRFPSCVSPLAFTHIHIYTHTLTHLHT